MMHRLEISITAVFLLTSSIANAACRSGDRLVGGTGTGGERSGFKAEGFDEELKSTRFPGETVKNVGNADAGQLSITNQGTPSGTFRGDTARGRGTGIFGDWTGLCTVEDVEAGIC